MSTKKFSFSARQSMVIKMGSSFIFSLFLTPEQNRVQNLEAVMKCLIGVSSAAVRYVRGQDTMVRARHGGGEAAIVAITAGAWYSLLFCI
ncbi:MAG TPA: hypothetical protein VE978_06000 [Chitinophagales bacterium]|nr:hypothetical protein [Chitinophagales bacterium]